MTRLAAGSDPPGQRGSGPGGPDRIAAVPAQVGNFTDRGR